MAVYRYDAGEHENELITEEFLYVNKPEDSKLAKDLEILEEKLSGAMDEKLRLRRHPEIEIFFTESGNFGYALGPAGELREYFEDKDLTDVERLTVHGEDYAWTETGQGI